jgi:hypothetical protein
VRGKYRRAEFPEDMVEQIIEDIRRIAEETETEELHLTRSPPPQAQHEELIRKAAAEVTVAVQALLPSGIRLRVRSERLESE